MSASVCVIGSLPKVREDNVVAILETPDFPRSLKRIVAGPGQHVARAQTDFKRRELDFSSIRERLSTRDRNESSARDVLFYLLCLVFETEHAREFTDLLLGKFGSLGAVLSISENHLAKLLLDHEDCLALLRSVHRAITLSLREQIEDKPLISNPSELYDYLRISLAQEETELVRILHLNAKNRLIKDELHSRGTVSEVVVYPRELVRSALECGACALIIVHNHPSGDPHPSPEDIEMTGTIKRLMIDLGITLHDHVIVTSSHCLSMKRLNLI